MLNTIKSYILHTARVTGGTILLVILLPVWVLLNIPLYILFWRQRASAPKALHLAAFMSKLNNNKKRK